MPAASVRRNGTSNPEPTWRDPQIPGWASSGTFEASLGFFRALIASQQLIHPQFPPRRTPIIDVAAGGYRSVDYAQFP